MSSERAVVGWLRRMFAPASRDRSRHAVQRKRAAPDLPEAAQQQAAPEQAWAEHAPDFAPHAQALALEFVLPAPLTQEQALQISQLASAVFEFAQRDDIGPSSLPTASLRILNLVARSDVDVTELAMAIQQDPALAAAVLRVANSAVLAPTSGEVSTVRDAVMRLGISESGRVAGVVAAKTLFSPRSKSAQAVFAEKFSELYVAAASAAGGAAYLAMDRAVGRSDLAYLGGMLHDVGKSLALAALGTLVLADRAPRELDLAVLEGVLERSNIELGAQAHERWGLPQYLTSLCASQHDANVPAGAAHAELHLVRVVSGLLALRVRPQSLERIAELTQSLGVLKLSPLQTRALDTELRVSGARVRQVLGL